MAQRAEPWTGSGEDGLPVLVMTVSQCVLQGGEERGGGRGGTCFSVFLVGNDNIPNSIVTSAPFPLGNYIKTLIYENKLCSGP